MLDSITFVHKLFTFVTRKGVQVLTPMQNAPASSPGSTKPKVSVSAPKGYAFDLDGTIYLQTELLPGALDLLQQLEARGIPFVFATNNSSVPGSVYVERLTSMGIGTTREQVLTSNDVAIAHLLAAGLKRPYLLAPPAVHREYESHGIKHEESEPDCVLLAFDTTLTYDKIAAAARFITARVPYLATHPDPVCPTLDGSIPDVGSFIEMFRSATGHTPTVLAKPHKGMVRLITERLGLPAGRIAFVGDRLETDILMARNHGFTGILTLTGVTGSADLAASELQPDIVITGLPDLTLQLDSAMLQSSTVTAS